MSAYCNESYKQLQAQRMRDPLTCVLDMLRELYTVGMARRVGANLHTVITSQHQDEMAAYAALRDLPSSLPCAAKMQNGANLLKTLPQSRPGARESAWVVLARNVVVA
ncbi:hypothetical protein JKP88DRAFT_249805 [Tribonema minus]|uniref:Uncharacterized protein n=1 Tax=Tribonema minus TaxID=303371 RepID=A0A835YLW8_9STRA|nr:hypothetical protein JKP88DRAFT_249805 [Tribonema minus]